MGLTIKELQEKLVKRTEGPFEHSLDRWSVMQWGCATAGEVGEACNVAKKIGRYELGMHKMNKGATMEELEAALADEISDFLQYGILWAASRGYDVEDLLRVKFNRVSDEMGSDIHL